jgi:hypothetical protein
MVLLACITRQIKLKKKKERKERKKERNITNHSNPIDSKA